MAQMRWTQGMGWLVGLGVLVMLPIIVLYAGSPKLQELEGRDPLMKARFENFDDLDFNVFTHQKWDELPRSHSDAITVHWPDGRVTTGLEKHVEDLRAMFVYAPDSRVSAHPIKIGQADWTAVVSVFEGTFTRPMPVGAGRTIPPTNKPFKLEMVTVGHWKNGVMDEEYLFWDNLTFMKQIGLSQ